MQETERKNELVVVEKTTEKIVKILKRIGIIALFFFVIYTVTELLNGNYVAFNKIFGIHSSFDEKIEYLKEACSYFFGHPKFISAILLYTFMYWIVYGLTNKPKLSCLLISSVSVGFSFINYIVTDLRGVPISLSDIFAVGTALNVAKGMKVDIDGELIIATILFIIAIIWLIKFTKIKGVKTYKSAKKRVSLVIFGIVGIITIANSPFTEKVQLWSLNYSYINYGSGLATLKMAKNFNITKPANYDRNDVEDILNSYNDKTLNYSGDLPNVLVVMNESLADLQSLFNIDVSGDPLSFFHEFMKEENIVSGVMHSSKFGGGTSIVEYEFLTQNSTAFLPAGAIPYQQYINKQVKNSIVTYMNKFNYNTFGIHCAPGSNYSRSKIYPLLQFKNTFFEENMENTELDKNGHIVDKYVYNYLKELLDEKKNSEKNFTFLLTLQKHSPYEQIDESSEQFVKDNLNLNSYMQSLSASDKALESLIKYLKNYDKKIILLLFGDHQPNLKLEETYGSNGVYDKEVSSHIVPFFIWANYDIEEKSGIEISANYLQGLFYEIADLPMDQYTQYVRDIRKEIPVITTMYYIGSDGNKYMLDDKNSPYYEKLQEYWKAIYYYMFDMD